MLRVALLCKFEGKVIRLALMASSYTRLKNESFRKIRSRVKELVSFHSNLSVVDIFNIAEKKVKIATIVEL